MRVERAHPPNEIAVSGERKRVRRDAVELARGKHANVVCTAIARGLPAFMWAIAKEVPLQA